jgi:phosphoglycerol transferase MdoB-like AlkP superfamily enzyme
LREAKQPTFFYWMTLSTHVPIAPHEGTPRLGCANGGGQIGNVEVCYMTELWMDLFLSVAQLARDLPGTEIMLVGDHAPPLWSKAGRNLFTPGKVTWVRLTPKAEQKVSQQP